MSKQEFLDTLRRALARELSESEVADNINYYWNYIEQQVASGKSEEQVLSELGDPRLIARTILQVDQQKEEAADPYYQNTVYTEDEPSGSYRQDVGSDPFEDDFGTQIHVRRLGVSDWIRIILVILIVLVVLGVFFHILWKLLPFLIAAAAVLWIYRKISGLVCAEKGRKPLFCILRNMRENAILRTLFISLCYPKRSVSKNDEKD